VTDENAFLEAIRLGPFDETGRLVYADWLQERDDPRAEFLRIESALVGLILQKQRDRVLAGRYLDLALALPESWVSAVDRVPELLRPSVKDGTRYHLIPRRGETMMFLLTGLFGLPEDASRLAPEQLDQAIRERRVVTVGVVYDRCGDWSVWVRRAVCEPDPYLRGDTELVFACVITDAILACLLRNYWERISEMFQPG
jgi:uncharacterized protein (TIGR02996 family)